MQGKNMGIGVISTVPRVIPSHHSDWEPLLHSFQQTENLYNEDHYKYPRLTKGIFKYPGKPWVTKCQRSTEPSRSLLPPRAPSCTCSHKVNLGSPEPHIFLHQELYWNGLLMVHAIRILLLLVGQHPQYHLRPVRIAQNLFAGRSTESESAF